MTGKKILIVDDNRDIRLGLNARLKGNGYVTLFAEDAISAMSVARKGEPDLVLLDLGLPGGSGFLVLDRLKNLPSMACVPVIVVTAQDPAENEKRALDEGAVAFFQKPVDHEELLAAIARALQ